jgi:hypothetical protein
MTACRVCSTRGNTAATVDGGGSGEPKGPVSVTLLLRVWRESDDLRCRLLSVTGAAVSSPQPVAVAQGVDDICDAVREWLLAL